MLQPRAGVSLNLVQDYLEVARAAAAILGPPGSPIAGPHGHPGLHNAVFTVFSMELIYAYLALDAFLSQAEEETGPAHSAAGLAARLDALCSSWGGPSIAEADPALDADLRVLERDALLLMSRGTAPYLDREGEIRDLLGGSTTECYAEVAECALRHLIGLKGAPQPDWLSRNVLLDLRASLVQ